MSDNNLNNNDNKENLDENWDQEIYEDDGSRTNRRSKSEKRTWFIVSIIVILFLIVLIPTGAILYSQMSGNLNAGKTVATSSSTTTISSSTKEESSTKESSSSTATSSSTTPSTTESFSDVEVPKNDPSTRGQVAQNGTEQNQSGQTNAQDQSQNQTQNPGGSTVAYGQGDSTRSLWKISQEAGITLDQLYQLNPGVTPENVQPGQPIRVQ
ncbi:MULTISPECIES: LysM domain-containing protein [Vagococcus]|uniref:LysM peptidoglycan-binding domain-containing protein n=1 Tax=Vagococcus TaxID=2737 RepID=UPI000E4E54D0|nr:MULTISPECIES: LysM domain-containing protein [Vagococcus]RHH70972.1 LysM domain-containing protein [Vagococcus sp. AM17-17]